MKNKLSVSIGIAAYNAQNNISRLLTALLKQKETDFNLKRIVVHSDASSDDTVKIIKSFRNRKIKVIDNKKRKGFGGSIKSLLDQVEGDIAVLLNDDIRITDLNLINKLIQPFISEAKIGLVCGHPLPLPPENFIENAALSSYKAFDRMRTYIKNGNSKYSCDGKILVLNSQFVNKLDFPTNFKKMGNVDAYMYFSCIEKGFEFRFIKDAVVYYRNPQNITDLINWQIRNNSNKFVLRKRFKKIIDQEYYKPPLLYWRCMLMEFIKNPLGCTFIFIFRFYINYQANKYSKAFNPTWELISTSKNI